MGSKGADGGLEGREGSRWHREDVGNAFIYLYNLYNPYIIVNRGLVKYLKYREIYNFLPKKNK